MLEYEQVSTCFLGRACFCRRRQCMRFTEPLRYRDTHQERLCDSECLAIVRMQLIDILRRDIVHEPLLAHTRSHQDPVMP